MSRPELPEVASSIRDEWRVVDARGETESVTVYSRVAWEVASALHGSTVWHRQVRTITTPWRQIDPRGGPLHGRDLRTGFTDEH